MFALIIYLKFAPFSCSVRYFFAEHDIEMQNLIFYTTIPEFMFRLNLCCRCNKIVLTTKKEENKMADVDAKRKRRPKGAQLLSYVKNFVFTHILTDREGEKSEAKQRRYTVKAARCVMGCIFAALMCRTQLAFSVYPFGIIYLCSIGRALPIYSLVSVITCLCLGGVSNVYALLYALILAVRSAACVYFDAKEEGIRRFPVYSEWIAYRVIFSCVASFIIGIYNLFYFGFTYYSLLGSLLVMAVCPVGTYIFCCGFDSSQKSELRDAARLVLCAVLVLSLSDLTLLYVRCAGVAAFCLMTAEASKKKKGACALMGLVCGLPFGISTAAVYALAATLCAALGSLSPFLGNLGAYTFIVMAQGYIGGYSALISCLPDTSIGLCLTLLWQKYNISERISCFTLPLLEKKERTEDQNVRGAAKSMEEVSVAFASLSNMLKALSSKAKRTQLLDTRGICEQSCDSVCPDCRKRSFCWEKNAGSTSDAFSKVSSYLSKHGRINEPALPAYLQSQCIKKEALVSQINKRTGQATEACFKKGGTDIFASDYEAMSKILCAHLQKAKEKDTLDRALSDALLDMCRRRLYGIGSIRVYGKRQKQIYAAKIDLASHTVSAAALRREFEKVCGCRLSSPVYSIDGADIEFEMHSEPMYSAECAIATLPKEGESCSGDSADSLYNNEGYFYGILCDGMGSGKDAAYTSGVCTEYLHNMLESSNPKELTIEMLNAVIREDPQECSSTVDLFELDTFSGEGCFIKSGAAPSFVCRQKNVYRVSAKTIPIGITERIGAEKIKFRLRRGDIVVMVSDGIVEGPDEGRLVVQQLCRRTTDNPFDIAASVLAAAKTKHNCRDDMTVVTVCVKDARK